jgi:Sensors of blue-light using FAD
MAALIAHAQARNQGSGITGYLIAGDRWFIQILEGEYASVMKTLGRIEKDVRHHTVTILGTQLVRDRDFGKWSMGYSTRPLQDYPVPSWTRELSVDFAELPSLPQIEALIKIIRQADEVNN